MRYNIKQFVVSLASALLCGSVSAHAQTTASIQFDAVVLSKPAGNTVLFGPTTALSTQVAKIHFLRIYGDLRGTFAGKTERLDQVGIGPRFVIGSHSWLPYFGMMLGFARYNNGVGTSSTDAQLEGYGGLDRKLSKHLDIRLFEFAYETYSGVTAAIVPEHFSAGIVYHFNR